MKNRTKWQKFWARHFGVLTMTAAVFSYIKNKRVLRRPFSQIIVIPQKGLEALYVKEDGNIKFYQALNRYYIENSKNLELFIKDFLKVGKDFVAKCKKNSKDVALLDNIKLAKNFKNFSQDYSSYTPYQSVIFCLNELINEKLVKILNSSIIKLKEHQKLLEYAIQPARLASALLFNYDAQFYRINQLTKKYPWLTTMDIHNNPASAKDIKNLLTPKKYKPIPKPKIFSKLPKNIKKIILLSRELIYLKDLKDDLRRKAIYEIIPLFEEIGKRLGISREVLSYLNRQEVTEALLSKRTSISLLKKKSVKRRKNGFLFWFNNGRLQFEDHLPIIEKFVRRLDLFVKQKEKISEIKGVIGCVGKAKGRVRVITSIKDLNKIQKGDILCAITTTVDYLPAIKKAIAIITDEGGITCHAAIVAREMRKPCLVGTKIATKVLKDGDLVEVDADKGTIKILG